MSDLAERARDLSCPLCIRQREADGIVRAAIAIAKATGQPR